MVRTLGIVIALSLLGACGHQDDTPGVHHAMGDYTGTQVEYYPDGSKKSTTEYAGGWRHGLRVEWFQNGSISLQGSYNMGHHDGAWEGWYENGGKQSQKKYAKDRILNATEWYEDGSLRLETSLEPGDEGYLHWVFYHPNGAKLCEGVDDGRGNRKGVWTYWNEDGSINKTEKY